MSSVTTGLPYADRFPAIVAALPGEGVPWLRELREGAYARIARLGLPTTRVERWKYTNLNPLTKATFEPALRNGQAIPSEALADVLPAETAAHRLVFVNGAFRGDLSRVGRLPDGVTLESLGDALARGTDALAPLLEHAARSEDNPFFALNTALMADGCVLRIGRGVAVEEPIHLVFVAAGGDGAPAYHPRNLILAERDSRAVLFESHVDAGGGTYWSNPVTQVTVEDGAALEHYKFQEEGPDAFHIALTAVEIAARGRYDSFVLTSGGRLSRQEIEAVLDGERSECRLIGGYLARGRQHIDNTTEIVHAKPHAASKEIYKGVLDEQARAVFQGRIVVEKDAQKTDGHQLNRTLLLSDHAEIDTKPELEIYADDVKCSHGATAGELEESALFYLRARGLDESAARRMLIEAFLADLGEDLPHPAARAALERRVSDWLTAI